MRTASRLALACCVVGPLLAGCGSGAPDDAASVSPWGPGSRTPHLALTADGAPLLSWLEPEGDAMALRHATYRDGAWRDVTTVATGTDWFVNWADFPSVTPIDDRFWAAHWLVKRPGGTYAYDIAVALSHDGGTTWGAPMTPHTDGTATEHGFVTLFPDDGDVGALWLDGREMQADGDHGHAAGGMTLRTARIDDDGAAADPRKIDGLVCDCCQTDVAIAASGPVAVYRNRTEAEVRDIYVARSIDGAWQPGTPVADDGWTIAGCPVNGPAVAAHGDRVAVAWFTAADDRPRVRVAVSRDGGATFGAAIDVDDTRPIGRVDIDWGDDERALVSWLDSDDRGQGRVVVTTLDRNGVLGDKAVVATTSAARASGFPQMRRAGDRVFFAWTETVDGGAIVRTAARPLDAF